MDVTKVLSDINGVIEKLESGEGEFFKNDKVLTYSGAIASLLVQIKDVLEEDPGGMLEFCGSTELSSVRVLDETVKVTLNVKVGDLSEEDEDE